MDTIKLLITDTAFFLSEKGKPLVEKTFVTNQECFSLISAALEKRKRAVVECLFSGSHLTCQTITVPYSEKEPFVADEKMFCLLKDGALHTFLNNHKEQTLTVVQEEVVTLTLNGYPVSSIKKQKVNELKVSLFFGALPLEYKKMLDTALGHHLKHASFAAFGWHQSKQLLSLSKKDEFMICSAYELSTDISLRKKNGYFQNITIPLGTHHAIEQVEKGLAVELFQNSLEEEVKKALTKLCDGLSLPSIVYLSVAPDFREKYTNVFKNDSYHSLCFSNSGFEVVLMSSILTT